MDVYLCIPGLDLQIDDLLELNINNYKNKLLWNTPTLDYFLRNGTKKHKIFSLSEIISNYILINDLKSQIINYLNLPVKQNYILVSPVFQKMHLHSMQLLYGNNILNISNAQAHRLCDDLNVFFAGSGMQFYMYMPDLWILSISDKFSFNSKIIFDIDGIVNYEDKPLGKDSNKLLKLQTDISTFLFNHEINVQRLQTGLLQINGAWVWNDIKSNMKFNLNNTIICGDVFWLPANSNLKHINFSDFNYINNNLIHENIKTVIIYIDILHRAILKYNINSHVSSLSYLEKDFFSILQSYLNKKIIKNLFIISNGKSGGILKITAKKSLFYYFKKSNRYQGKWF